MKYFGGCDVGSTYTKAVILDENGKMVADTTLKSKIIARESAELAMKEVISQVPDLNKPEDLAYLIGTGYGRNKVPFADENVSEISCHAMGVHITNPTVKAIIDIGGQDVKGIAIDTDGTVKNFAMNDKCAAGTGRFYEAMARSFEMTLPEFSKLSLTAKNVIPITHARRRGQADERDRSRHPDGCRKEMLRHGEKGRRHGFHHTDRRLRKEQRLKGCDRARSEAEGRGIKDRPAAHGCSRSG